MYPFLIGSISSYASIRSSLSLSVHKKHPFSFNRIRPVAPLICLMPPSERIDLLGACSSVSDHNSTVVNGITWATGRIYGSCRLADSTRNLFKLAGLNNRISSTGNTLSAVSKSVIKTKSHPVFGRNSSD